MLYVQPGRVAAGAALRRSGTPSSCASPGGRRFRRVGDAAGALPTPTGGPRPPRAPRVREYPRLPAERRRGHARAEAGLSQLHRHALLLALVHQANLLRPRAARDFELVRTVAHLLPERVAERLPRLERAERLAEIVHAVAARSRFPHLVADLPHSDPGGLESERLLEPARPVRHSGT